MSDALRIPAGAPLAFPRLYVWYLILAVLDLAVTTVILSLGGSEVNGFAAWALRQAGLPGLVAVKFVAVAIVVVIVETIWHSSEDTKRRATALRLAEWAVAVSAIPVAVGSIQLLAVG